MLGTFGKVAVWVLALVGGYVVVRKYAPDFYSKTKDKILNAKNKVKELTTGSITLIPCSEGNPAGGSRPPNKGVQSSPFFKWCYLVSNGDSAGSISEKITGDSSRYAEILVANPDIPKKGKMGIVLGEDAWDFAPGVLSANTKIFIPQTMNSWIDQFGVAKGGYLPYPPDARMMVETSGSEIEVIEDENTAELITSDSDGFDFQGA